jgi:hypothetical protein
MVESRLSWLSPLDRSTGWEVLRGEAEKYDKTFLKWKVIMVRLYFNVYNDHDSLILLLYYKVVASDYNYNY